jgi:hypothetical protein
MLPRELDSLPTNYAEMWRTIQTREMSEIPQNKIVLYNNGIMVEEVWEGQHRTDSLSVM